ncbi:MAG: hypothetical protein JWO12_1781 [Frankiales bacterium]|nr:hypothetical protein [Frankiales bacterium]
MRRSLASTTAALCATALVTGGLTLTHLNAASALSGVPAFTSYAAPSSLPGSTNAGEPSLGVNGSTGAMMYMAGTNTLKLVVNAAGVGTWTDVTPPGSAFNIDPIASTDRTTGRTFAGGLAGECSALSYSDNDGGSWTQMGNACTGVVDHESIGSGPWKGAAPLGSTYSHAVYYCAQNGNDACVTSSNGGLTFGAPTLVSGACSSLHGHVKVSADGTAYLPNAHCGGVAGGAITSNNGSSWTSYTIPGSSEPTNGFDPSVATTPDNTVYEAWQGANNHPMVAVSKTHSSSWTTPVDLGALSSPAIVTSTFQAVTAGDNGRAAVAYLGSTTGGDPFAQGWPGVWDLYVSYTYDGGTSWSTVKASADPVQRGWMCASGTTCGSGRNLLDFMDANLTKDGRVVVGYADGCVGTCAASNGTEAQSTAAYATVAYQSSGKGLLAAYDTTSTPTPTPTATATASPTASPTTSPTATPTATATVTPTTTPASDPDPATPTLTSGTPRTGTSAPSGGYSYAKVLVPAGKSQLKITLSGPSCGTLGLSCNPDLDLYTKAGAKPTTTVNDGSSAASGSTETITVASPTAAYWYVGVYTYSGSKTASYTVTATVS